MRRDLRCHHAAHQPVGGLEHRDGLAEKTGGGGDLEADEAAADDHHVGGRVERGAQPPRVGCIAQREDAVEVDAGDGRTARAGAGGDDQTVEGDGPTVGERDPFGGKVDGDDLDAAAELDGVLRVEGQRPERQEVVGGILEEGLGQRWPLVGHLILGGDKGQPAVVTLGAQAGGGL